MRRRRKFATGALAVTAIVLLVNIRSGSPDFESGAVTDWFTVQPTSPEIGERFAITYDPEQTFSDPRRLLLLEMVGGASGEWQVTFRLDAAFDGSEPSFASIESAGDGSFSQNADIFTPHGFLDGDATFEFILPSTLARGSTILLCAEYEPTACTTVHL